MVEAPSEWLTFGVYFQELERSKDDFSSFSLSCIPRLNNSKADLLARSARRYPYDVSYVNTCLPV